MMNTTPSPTPEEIVEELKRTYQLTDTFSAPDWDKYERQGLMNLMRVLPPRIQQIVHGVVGRDPFGLEEIVLEVAQPPTIRYRGRELYGNDPDLITTERDIEGVRDRLASRIKTNGRAGIEGTLHRVSARTDSTERIVGFTIRIARAIPGVAEGLRPYLERQNPSLLIIGPPGVGKTTVLRDVARILSSIYGRRTAIIDTSGEIAGEGTRPHPIIGFASRFAVPDPRRQAEYMLQAVANHSPRVLLVDEISTLEEAEAVLQFGRKGVAVVSSIHGYSLREASENPAYYPLLGIPRDRDPDRLVKPLYGAAIEILEIGRARVIEDITSFLRAYVLGEPEPIEGAHEISLS